MDKIKINLLPKEIIEKRKAEQRLAFMLLGSLILILLMAAVYGYGFILVIREQSNVNVLKAENVRYEQEIARIADFETSKVVVEEREKVVNSAIADKRAWSKLLNNISLIVPNEVWFTALTVGQDGALGFSGSAKVRKTAGSIGQKAVAKWLVHLSAMEGVSEVWLSKVSKSQSGGESPSASGASSSTVSIEEVQFETNAKISN